MIQKIKCFFGFHEMKTLWSRKTHDPMPALFFHRKCTNCDYEVEGCVL